MSLNVTLAVPEPSTWAMMIFAFCRRGLHGLSPSQGCDDRRLIQGHPVRVEAAFGRLFHLLKHPGSKSLMAPGGGFEWSVLVPLLEADWHMPNS